MFAFAVCVACAPSGGDFVSKESPDWDVKTSFEAASDGASGVLVVRASAPDTAVIRRPEPEGQGLRFESMGQAGVESLGARQLYTWRWRVEGRPGNYEIQPLDVFGEANEPMVTAPGRFVDLATEAPAVGELQEVQHPSKILTIPWALVAGVLGTLAVLVVGLRWLASPAPPEEEEVVPPEAPDLVVLRMWSMILEDASLETATKAKMLSRIFREYLETAMLFPATAWTTTETLAHLAQLSHMSIELTPQAQRLLRATDRVKFAGDVPQETMLEHFTEDLHGFVRATRPHRWDEDDGEAT
jgi:hypothetical protein